MSRYWVGMTGGIASGKSTVGECFSQHHVTVIDADQIARAVVAPGTPALNAIIDHFGEHIVTAEGHLDRPALRQQIFSAPEQRQWLDQLLHPQIREQLKMAAQQAPSPYVILMIPLLFETGWQHRVNRVLVVDVPETVQLERLLQRDGGSLTTARQILAAQMNRQQRLAGADDVIDNNRGLPEVTKDVIHLHDKYLSLATAS